MTADEKRKLLEDEGFEYEEPDAPGMTELWYRNDVNIWLSPDGTHSISIDWLPD